MKPQIRIMRSLTHLAIAAAAVIMMGTTAHAQLLKNQNKASFVGAYACGGSGAFEGTSFSYEFVLAPTGYGSFTGGNLVFLFYDETDTCKLDIANSSYNVLPDGEGSWALSWNCNCNDFTFDDEGTFNGTLLSSPTGHFEQVRFTNSLANEFFLTGSGDCQRQLP